MAHVDFEIAGGGTVYLLHPLTHGSHDWVAEGLPANALRLGDPIASSGGTSGTSLAVSSRTACASGAD